MADPLRGFEYGDALESIFAELGPAHASHDLLSWLQQIQFSSFRLTLFSGERLIVGPGRGLAYKQRAGNWNV